MLKATKGKILPTAIIGSLPRPSWYNENLGTRSFVDAMANNKFREQYVDALSCYLKDQEVAGLDIVTDGDCRSDLDQLPAASHDRLRSHASSACPCGRGRHRFSARTHPA